VRDDSSWVLPTLSPPQTTQLQLGEGHETPPRLLSPKAFWEGSAADNIKRNLVALD